MLGRPSPSDESVYRQGSRATQDEGGEAGEVQEVTFISWRPELGAGRGHGHELDRAESVGQMHGEDGHEQQRSHRYGGQHHERTQDDCQTANELSQ